MVGMLLCLLGVVLHAQATRHEETSSRPSNGTQDTEKWYPGYYAVKAARAVSSSSRAEKQDSLSSTQEETPQGFSVNHEEEARALELRERGRSLLSEAVLQSGASESYDELMGLLQEAPQEAVALEGSPQLPCKEGYYQAPEAEYCPGKDSDACEPPHKCLPCHVDPDFSVNGLGCQACGLVEDAGTKVERPSCTACRAGPKALIKLLDGNGLLERSFCQEPGVRPGTVPRLCEPPAQENAKRYWRPASLGEVWQMKDSHGRKVDVLARLTADRVNQAEGFRPRLAIFKREGNLMNEYLGHWAGTAMTAELYVDFNLLPGHNFVNIDPSLREYFLSRFAGVVGNETLDAFISKGIDKEQASKPPLWYLVSVSEAAGGEPMIKVRFGQPVSDLRGHGQVDTFTGKRQTTSVGDTDASFYLSVHALAALGACFDYFDDGKTLPIKSESGGVEISTLGHLKKAMLQVAAVGTLWKTADALMELQDEIAERQALEAEEAREEARRKEAEEIAQRAHNEKMMIQRAKANSDYFKKQRRAEYRAMH